MKHIGLFFVLVSLFLASCQDDISLNNSEITLPKETHTSDSYQKIDTFDVTFTDISNVISAKRPLKSRSKDYTISTKVDNSKALFHVVNFQDGGFMILSSTKKVSPILAESENGNFDINDPNNPTFIWQAEMSEYINRQNALPFDSVKEAYYEWQTLLYNDHALPLTLSKPSSRSDGEDISQEKYMELQTLVMEERLKWQAQGYKVYAITELVGDEEWSNYAQQRAREAVFPLYENYWESLCFIVEHDEIEFNDKYQVIKTQWHQEYPYNRYCPIVENKATDVGCGPLAIGQIMYHYEYPNIFNWANMKTGDHANDDFQIASMLREIGNKCQTKYTKNGSETDYKPMKKALEDYGYNVNPGYTTIPCIGTANYKAWNSEENKYESTGHAWIEGGIWSYLSHHYYICWGVTESKRITDFERSPDYSLALTQKYYVWGGRNGAYDGWYYDVNKHPQNGQPFYNKKYLYIANPNR